MANSQNIEQQPADYDQGWKDGYKHGAWASEQQPADEPVAWKVDVDLQNFQGQSEYRTILAWNAKPVWTGTHEINEVLKAVPLYTRPQPAAQWVGLTDEEIALVCAECAASAHRHDDISYARAIEAKLKEKNT